MKTQKERLYKDVAFLTEIRPFRNYRHTETLNKVYQYIQNELEKMGLEVSLQQWDANGNTYTNVIASYNSSLSKRMIVGAHYDVCGDQPGADDNASAVAGLLETARLLTSQKPTLDYRIDFVAYCLEEPPFFNTENMGSYVHAKSLFDTQTNVIGMICYEMIGYFSDEPNSQTFPLEEMAEQYPSTANFIVVVGIEKYADFNKKVYDLMLPNAQIDIQPVTFEDEDLLAGLSDHRSYWAFGYQAVMINDTAFIRNPNYHLATDTIDTLDFDKMVAVVNSTYQAVVGW